MSRFGIAPTGIRVTSFLDPTSNTETAFEPALETKHRLPSAENVSQSGASPTLVVPSRLRSGSENTDTELPSRLVTHNVFWFGAIPIPCENVLGISGLAPGGPSGSKTVSMTLREARSTTTNP